MSNTRSWEDDLSSLVSPVLHQRHRIRQSQNLLTHAASFTTEDTEENRERMSLDYQKCLRLFSASSVVQDFVSLTVGEKVQACLGR
jgi:hypothetical protein